MAGVSLSLQHMLFIKYSAAMAFTEALYRLHVDFRERGAEPLKTGCGRALCWERGGLAGWKGE